MFSAVLCLAAWTPPPANGDIIKFKRGAKKKCVVVEETEEWVSFLTSMGVVKMPRARIVTIERESDEVNEALREEWEQDNKRTPREKPKEKPETAEKEPKLLRTYKVDIRKRRIMLGGRASGVREAQPVAFFKIEDMGMVEGSRLFRVGVTSYLSARHSIRPPDFYVLSENGMRSDPRPLEGYDDLHATLNRNETAQGYVAFPTKAELKTMVVRSDIASFQLNLETGGFVTEGGPF